MTTGTDATFTLTNTRFEGLYAVLRYSIEADPGITVSPSSGAIRGDGSHTITVSIEPDTTGEIRIRTNGIPFDETIQVTTAPDYFTMDFDSAVELAAEVANKTFLFSPQHDGTYKATQGDADFAPHIDPVDATPVLGTAIDLTQPVMLYGQTYDRITILEDGAVELGNGGGWAVTRMLAAHFANPGVSAMRAYLDVSAPGASIRYEEATDGVIVTYTGIPEVGETWRSTFQIVIYTNGAVELTYEDAVAANAVIGLSAGGGVPDDYVPSDFSNFAETTPALKASF
ncbi:MAG TPA: hypothetical protein HPP77_02910 [Candidatus Hydrogenedentes bacterium]|nr:hypothetical protein [Candidatus Hydrogenedentota bacterium]HIJ74685.1 hypothetical protein [Candidatus Hydrogenedentota bacterium]